MDPTGPVSSPDHDRRSQDRDPVRLSQALPEVLQHLDRNHRGEAVSPAPAETGTQHRTAADQHTRPRRRRRPRMRAP